MNQLEQEYREKVFTYLQSYTSQAVQALREILSRDFPSDVVFLNFVMFPYDRIGDHLPVYTWPTTLANTCHSFECPLSRISTEGFDYYDEEIEDYVECGWHLSDCVARWLRSAWQKAGGEFFRLPCYFTDHDHPESFSFKLDRWIRNDSSLKLANP